MARVKIDRSQAIIEQVLQSSGVPVEELATDLGASQATIRRELRRLEAEGLLQRNHGSVVPIQSALYRPYMNDSSFAEQVSRQVNEKARIGIEAARLVGEGETIAISAGATTTQMARSLDHRMTINVFTNALNIGMELAQRKNLMVILSGGVM